MGSVFKKAAPLVGAIGGGLIGGPAARSARPSAPTPARPSGFAQLQRTAMRHALAASIARMAHLAAMTKTTSPEFRREIALDHMIETERALLDVLESPNALAIAALARQRCGPQRR